MQPIKSSPRPWGCFSTKAGRSRLMGVFPTPVGVFLGAPTNSLAGDGLPHARGGVSWLAGAVDDLIESSPRPWGCFRRTRRW